MAELNIGRHGNTDSDSSDSGQHQSLSNLHLGNPLLGNPLPGNTHHSNRSNEGNTSDSNDSMGPKRSSFDLPIGLRSDRTSGHHKVIFNTLSMLQNSESDKGLQTPDSQRSGSGLSPRHSVRNSLLSRTSEIMSPSRNLPTLVESENENNPNADNADFDLQSVATSDAASSIHARLFQNALPRLWSTSVDNNDSQHALRLRLPADINDTNSVILTSVRSTPDVRAGSHVSLDSIRSAHLGGGVVVAEAQTGGGAPRRGGRTAGVSSGNKPPRIPRRTGNVVKCQFMKSK